MRGSLADSLDYIYQTVGPKLDAPLDRFAASIDSIRSHRVAPGVFGRYYKLVLAVQGGAYHEARAELLGIMEAAGQIPSFRTGLYTDASLGDDRRLFGELIDPHPGASPWLCEPCSDDGFGRRVLETFELMAVADMALAAEMRGLVVHVVGAMPFDGPGARPFGSVSSFMLWGLLIVNMARYRTAADLIQGMVHEAAHLLLFAHSIDEPLVTNAIEERYTSPLRSDPRPMDGVFHATFVSARMHYVNRKLREASTATFQPVALEELENRLTTLRALYFGGLTTVREHAKLTGSGRRILEETLDYMQAV